MWKPEHRRAADRHGFRYPSDLSDSEWALIEPAIPPAKRGGRRREVNVREVLNAIFYIETRQREGREVSPTAAIIDSQSAKGAQKGAPRSIRKGLMRARRSPGASAISWSIRSAFC